MDAAFTIREAVARVADIRIRAMRNPALQAARTAVKSFQSTRFSATYFDLLSSAEYGAAAQFFLEDLYSEKDYSQRDAQFSRIAGAIQALFPHQVVTTAVALAQLHLLTEELDLQMASSWLAFSTAENQDAVSQYVACWKSVGRQSDRRRQLEMVLNVGSDLDRLTRTTGLRFMLKMMRKPAIAAGLGSLQSFLESGFDTFSNMSGNGKAAIEFLDTIRERESYWIELLSLSGDLEARAALNACLSNSRTAGRTTPAE